MGFEYFLLVFTSIFIILDPFANIPVFSLLLNDYTYKDKKEAISKSFAIALTLFFLFSIFGKIIFLLLGISISAFKIAGGILLGIIAMEILFGKISSTKTKHPERLKQLKEEKEDLSVVPLATPMLTGPGAIITGIVLFEQASSIELLAEFFLGSITAFLFTYLLISRQKTVEKIIGRTGMKVATRVMGLLLLSIAVQFVLKGILEAIKLI